MCGMKAKNSGPIALQMRTHAGSMYSSALFESVVAVAGAERSRTMRCITSVASARNISGPTASPISETHSSARPRSLTCWRLVAAVCWRMLLTPGMKLG